MGLNKMIYSGRHYHWDKENHLKKENISLRSYKNKQQEKSYIFQVGKQSRTFKDEEFCFFELEEIEFNIMEHKSKKAFICLAPNLLEECLQNFLCLTVVIYKVEEGYIPCMYHGSNRIRLFERLIPGKKCSLRNLGTKLKRKFGSDMKQWFMYSIRSNNNEQPVRVVLRKSNFSILDHQLSVLHYHSLQSLEFQEFLINPLQGLINMNITDTNVTNGAQRLDQINLRYSLSGNDIAYDFRKQLCNTLHELHFLNHNEADLNATVNTDQNPDQRVLDWIRDLGSILNHFYENDFPPSPHEPFDFSSDISPQSSGSERGNDTTWNEDDVPLSPPTPHWNCLSKRRNAVEGTWYNDSGSEIESQRPPPAPHRNSIKSSRNSLHSCKSKQNEATEGSWPCSGTESCASAKPLRCSSKLPKNHLLRAESINDLSTCKWQRNSCNNSISDVQKGNTSSYDDNDYRTIYYKNLGWVRFNMKTVDMKRRIQRQWRMKAQLPDVDFEIVGKHENWWDNKYKTNDEDEAFQRTSARKISNKPCPCNTDYWNGDLCITVQLMMEKKSPKILPELDLSWSQLLAVIIHLSVDVHPAILRKDWRDLAELLGLVTRDMDIINYFCYTQREWPARVVLSHWKLLEDKGRQVPCFSLGNLRQILEKLGRNDILKIVDYTETNCYEDNEESLCTHF